MASRSVNKVILLGHLGKDAETKFTPLPDGSTLVVVPDIRVPPGWNLTVTPIAFMQRKSMGHSRRKHGLHST